MTDDKPFSIREGFAKERTVQIDSLDSETLVRLRNEMQYYMPRLGCRAGEILHDFFTPQRLEKDGDSSFAQYKIVLHRNNEDIPLEEIRANELRSGLIDQVIKYYAKPNKWDDLFDFCEFIVNEHKQITNDLKGDDEAKSEALLVDAAGGINRVFKKMNVGYRLSADSGLFVPIHSQEEADEVSRAAASGGEPGEHIRTAIALFSNRDEPDYDNTFKEAISAVESLVMQETGKSNLRAGLSELVKDKSFFPHPAFAGGIDKLYGFASDKVRHGRKKGQMPIDQDTARLMLILCSALVNYIAARRAGADDQPAS